jgi:N-acyl-D-amino-acid deacylase
MRISVTLPLALLLNLLAAPAQEFDLVVRGGRIADGSGKPAFKGDVAIRGGRIAAVGRVKGKGKTEINAQGKVVAPGFIDVHTHSEDIAELPLAENFLRMGVTTIITGNCGGSKLDVAKFFEEITRSNVALNVATLIGHNTVRRQVMGGSFLRPPTADELEKMKSLVDQAMKDGAVGLSTGLIYLPGTFAKTDEIIELAKVAARHGGIYVSHMRHETAKIFDAIEELCRIAREAGLPAEVSHIKLSGPNAWGKADQVLKTLDAARATGLRITHDQYAYTASSTGLSQLIPDTAREGGSQKFLERIANPEMKAQIIAEMKKTLRNSKRTDYAYAVIAQYRKDKSLNGKTIPEAAKLKRGSDSLDDQIELLFEIEANGGGSAVYHNMDEPDLQKFLRHPLTMIASDAGPRDPKSDSVPHPRGYGNNARVLGRYVRELKVLKLEDAIRKMTSLPARTFQLKDRGELQPGFVADLVVFDPQNVSDPSTFDDPHHYAVGFSDILVNGVPVIRNGEVTAARPGRPVKR